MTAVERTRAVDFPYDYIFADATMAAPAGFAFAESWRSAGQPEKLLMLLTTENQRHDLAHLRQLAVSAHLVKPVGAADLFDALALVAKPAGGEGDDFQLAPFEVESSVPSVSEKPLDVLLVEDNPVNQELALRLLERQGHQVTVANNGAEGVEQFESKHFDVILMDMQMPVMGGIEATEAIRSREMRRSWVISDSFRPVYIVAMTANVMASDREQCFQAGMNDFVTKPLRPEDLVAALARAQGESVNASACLEEAGGDGVVLDLRAALSDIGDIDLLLSMASMFVAEWDGHLERVRHAVDARDVQELRLHAHTLKSLLAMFHAESARRWSLELEHAAMAAEGVDWGLCTQRCAALVAEMAQAKPLLEHFVSTRLIP